MGDGEQQKGQVAEAIRFANKYNLDNLNVIIDNNQLQAEGKINEIMPNDFKNNYLNSNWELGYSDGHNSEELYYILKKAYINNAKPTCIIAKN